MTGSRRAPGRPRRRPAGPSTSRGQESDKIARCPLVPVPFPGVDTAVIDDAFAEQILSVRRAYTSILPDRTRVHQFVEDLVELLFPHLGGGAEYTTAAAVRGKLSLLADDLRRLLQPQEPRLPATAEAVVEHLFLTLPELYPEALARRTGHPRGRPGVGEHRRGHRRLSRLLRHLHPATRPPALHGSRAHPAADPDRVRPHPDRHRHPSRARASANASASTTARASSSARRARSARASSSTRASRSAR